MFNQDKSLTDWIDNKLLTKNKIREKYNLNGATTNGIYESNIKTALLKLQILLCTYQTIDLLIVENIKNALKALFSDCLKCYLALKQ